MHLPFNIKALQRSLGASITPGTPEMSLDAAGLVALADLTTVQKRTALTGTSSLLDSFILCPGMHMQQDSTSLNGGEYPACGALTSGYVFRVENPATVYYLQQVGRTGRLTNLRVSQIDDSKAWPIRFGSLLFSSSNTTLVSALAYGAAVSWAIAVTILLGLSHDWWALGVILMLMASRLCNVVVIRRRAVPGWFGASEPGVDGDLLILLSQDRWVRIKGKVDHLKAVTSGQWLRDQHTVENWVTAVATLAVYLAAAMVSNATRFGQILILALLGGSVGLLAVTNSATEKLMMHGHILEVVGPSREYRRRLDLANELIKETGSDKWAVRMGMISKSASTDTTEEGPVVM
ncbi:hypothetical protein CGGC5_v016507 [Colletotrichum fructicola Nara gc5]|uniref:Uncharacterized protein n=1 Tax=Colletotrichum fructicola (strain Nara gc5) TaxID=1213859 RepID=A0A7J6ICB4_COLFN|nr:hypothetical protein CGGC5_v016507 [Colletotrichum fructicola Nara gc5]KAF4881189.1 hypothetical protein CGCFRS4_v015809 [Colletotrichum fructicola]